ncbi:MAG: hypothetical protein IPM55_21510, partial [Acidobacteria bacterium]|nr:hypothetical protein [Acidobacteriota bacterium]
LSDIGARIPNNISDEPFRKALKSELEEHVKSQNELPVEKRRMDYETKRNAERFIDERLEPLLEMAQALHDDFPLALEKGDKPFIELVDAWTRFRIKQERYSEAHEGLVFDLLGRQLLTFALWARNDIKASSTKVFVEDKRVRQRRYQCLLESLRFSQAGRIFKNWQGRPQ